MADRIGEGNSPSPAPSRRRKRGILVFLLCFCLILLPLLVHLNQDRIQASIRNALVHKVEAVTGGRFELGRFRFRFFPMEFTLEKVHLLVPAGAAPGLSLRVRSVRAGLTPGDLIRYAAGQLSLDRLSVEEPELVLDRSTLLGGRDRSGASPFDLRVGKLRVEAGRFSYQGREIPVGVDVSDLRVNGAWVPSTESVKGFIQFRTVLRGDPFPSGLPIRLSGGFEQRGPGVELRGIQVHAPGVEADLKEGLVTWDDRVRLSGNGRMRGDLAEFRKHLAGDVPVLEGDVEGDLRVLLDQGEVDVHSRLQGLGIRVGPLVAETFQADTSFDLDGIGFSNMKAGAFGGLLNGGLFVPWDRSKAIRLDVAGERLESLDLFRILALPLPFTASTSLELGFEGVWSDPSGWNGSGGLTLTAHPPRGSALPVDGTGSFRIESGNLQVEMPSVRTSGAEFRVAFQEELGAKRASAGILHLKGLTRDARATQSGVLTVLTSIDIDYPGELQVPLDGTGRLEAVIRSGEESTLDLDLGLDDGAWEGNRFNLMEFRLGLRGNRLALKALKLIGETWDIRGGLEADLDEPALISMDLDANGFPLRRALSLAGIHQDWNGRVTSEIHFSRGRSGLEGSGRFLLEDATISGVLAGGITGRFLAEHDLFHSTELRWTGPGLDLTGEVGWDTSTGQVNVTGIGGSLEPAKTEVWPESLEGAKLPIGVRGNLAYDGTALSGRLELEGRNWSIFRQSVPDTRTVLVFDRSVLKGRIESSEGESVRGEFVLPWTGRFPLDGRIRFHRLPFHWAWSSEVSPLQGRLSGSLDFTGDLEDGAVRAAGRLEKMDFKIGTHKLELANPAGLEVGPARVVAGPLHLIGRDSDVSLRLEIDPVSGRLKAACGGTLDLAALAAPVPDMRAHGKVNLDLTAEGTVSEPGLEGTLSVENGWVRMIGFPQPLEEVNGELRFHGDEAELVHWNSRFGGGEISGEGGVGFDRFLPDSYYLDLSCTSASLAYPEGFRGVYEGSVRLRGDTEEALVDGRLHLLRGLYDEPMDVSSLMGYGVREYESDEAVRMPVPVAMNMDLDAEDGVWMKNDLVELETGLNLHLGGTLGKPEITGRFRLLEGGKIRFRDVEYRIRSGSLDLLNLNRIDPYIDITAVTNVEQYEIVLRMEGTAEKFEYSLTSTPSLSQQDIIALLTTGTTLENLTRKTGNTGLQLSGDLATNYFAGALTGMFENRLKKVFRLERVRITPYAVSGTADPTTQVTLGKEVANRLFLIYSTSLGGEEREIYKMDWQASRKFNLTAERDTRAGVGGGLEFSDRFWLRRRKPARIAEPNRNLSGREIPPGSRLREIHVTGVAPEVASRLKKKISFRPGSIYRRSLLFEGEEQIRKSLVEEGYVHAVLRSEAVSVGDGAGEVAVTYSLDPGSRWEVRFEGIPGGEKKKLLKEMREAWIDSVFVDESFQDSLRMLREYYQDRGYYAVDIEKVTDNAGKSSDARSVTFRIDPGAKVRVRSLRFQGNSAIPDKRIRQQVLTGRAGSFGNAFFVPKTLENDLGAIRNLYRDQGFLQVRTLEPVITLDLDATHADILIPLEEGPRFTLSEIEFTGERPVPETRLRDWAELAEGEIFSPRVLQEAEAGIRAGLDREGYPDARVNGIPTLAGNTVQVRFELTPGQKMVIGEVRIQGSHRTKADIIRRELTLRKRDPVSRERILESQHHLYRLGLFSSVKISYDGMLEKDPGIRTLLVTVQESPPFRLRVGAGYSSEDGAKGALVLAHENVGGYDRSITFNGRISEVEKWGQVLIEEPRLFTRKWPALISILNERREEIGFSFRRRSTAFRVEHEFRKNWKRYLRYNFQRVDLFDIQAGSSELILEQKLEALDLGDLGLAMTRDTRDDPFLTRNGSYSSAELQLFAPVFLSDETFSKLSARTAWSRTFRSGGTFGVSGRIGLAKPFGSTGRVPLSERYFAGGDLTHRGFGRDELGPRDVNGVPIGGESMLLFNQEWRQPIWGVLRGVVFYDAGNVFRRLGDMNLQDLRHALGLGLHVETPIGPVRFEYGWKLDRKPGESGGEFFVSIGQIF